MNYSLGKVDFNVKVNLHARFRPFLGSLDGATFRTDCGGCHAAQGVKVTIGLSPVADENASVNATHVTLICCKLVHFGFPEKETNGAAYEKGFFSFFNFSCPRRLAEWNH
jgi:hypothetical protein